LRGGGNRNCAVGRNRHEGGHRRCGCIGEGRLWGERFLGEGSWFLSLGMGSAFAIAGVVRFFNSSSPEDVIVFWFLAFNADGAFKTLGFLLGSGLLWTLNWLGRYRGEVGSAVV